MARLVYFEFTTPGTVGITIPAGIKAIFAKGCGGGGGGGGGRSINVHTLPVGGAGGGASIEHTVPLDVTPGTTYYVTVGAGGAGGGANATGTSGADSFISTASNDVPNQMICWPGAAPGTASPGSSLTPFGGIPTRDGIGTSQAHANTHNGYHQMPGKGGFGVIQPATGWPGYYGGAGAPGAGGAPAAVPSLSGINGGGAGGGGAGGSAPGSNGGAGGQGGDSGGFGVAGAGGNGANAAGYGAGGGGGGSSGNGGSGGGAGTGGSGSGGRVAIWWWE